VSQPIPLRSCSLPRTALALLLAAAASILGTSTQAAAQDEARGPGDGPALRLMAGHTGLAIGNVPRVNGVRINWSDRHLEEVNGVNFTLWRTADGGRAGGRIQGVAAGLMPAAGMIRGVGVGLAAVVGESGGLEGFHAAGLALVGGESLRGAQLAGLATISGGSMQGAQAAGLSVIAESGMRGVQAAGLAVVSGADLAGAQAAGLAILSSGSAQGLQLAGLAVVADGGLQGIQASGAVLASQGPVRGVTVTGFRIRAPEVSGLSATVGWVDTRELRGISVAGYHRVDGIQTGLAVGVYNSADQLRGIQLGLLNRAGNNRSPFRYLPFLNASF